MEDALGPSVQKNGIVTNGGEIKLTWVKLRGNEASVM